VPHELIKLTGFNITVSNKKDHIPGSWFYDLIDYANNVAYGTVQWFQGREFGKEGKEHAQCIGTYYCPDTQESANFIREGIRRVLLKSNEPFNSSLSRGN